MFYTGSSGVALYESLSSLGNDQLSATNWDTLIRTVTTLKDVRRAALQYITLYVRSENVWRPDLNRIQGQLEKLTLFHQNNTLIEYQPSFQLAFTILQKSSDTYKTSSTNFDLNFVQQQEMMDILVALRNFEVNRIAEFGDLGITFYQNAYVRIPNIGSIIEPLAWTNRTINPCTTHNLNEAKCDIYFPKWKLQCDIVGAGDAFLTSDYSVRWSITVDDNPLARNLVQANNPFIVVETNARSDTFSFMKNLTFLTQYTSTIFVIGTNIANAQKAPPETIWMIDMPDASQIVKVCEAIMLARSDEDLEEEMMLYHKLLDLVRSPEMIRMITKEQEKFIHEFRAEWMKQAVWNAKRIIMANENKAMLNEMKERERKKRLLKKNMG